MFLVAVILFVVLKVTEGDAGRADQLASVISMIVGLASLLVTVVGVVGGVRSSGAAAPMMTPEQIFASDLRDLIGRSGKPSQQILNRSWRLIRVSVPTCRPNWAACCRDGIGPTAHWPLPARWAPAYLPARSTSATHVVCGTASRTT